MSAPRRVGIVGAGILGLAVAHRLRELIPEAAVTVIDKERECAAHQTGHKSGVMHAGVYYTPGSLKATPCRRSIEMLKSFCDEHGVPYDECGKVIVAHDVSEFAAAGRNRATRTGQWRAGAPKTHRRSAR